MHLFMKEYKYNMSVSKVNSEMYQRPVCGKRIIIGVFRNVCVQ